MRLVVLLAAFMSASPALAETRVLEPVALTDWKAVYGRIEARDLVSARARLLRLEPDLLIAGKEQVGIVMFAHFAEGMKKWKQQALSPAPVLGWCRLQARQIWPDKTPQCWVVFPMEGQAVELLF